MLGDPHTAHGQVLGAMCLMCRHYVPAHENAAQGNVARPTCAAFPEGIPDRIMYGTDDWHIPDPHVEPAPEQTNQVVFEPADDVDDEMVAFWDEARMKIMKSRAREQAGFAPGEDIDGTIVDHGG